MRITRTTTLSSVGIAKRFVLFCSSSLDVYVPWLLIARSVATSATLLALLFLRSHLFVWTVFAPKLLYEGSHTAVVVIVVLLSGPLRLITRRQVGGAATPSL